MSDFFDSDIVRQELQEINQLQMSIYRNAMKFGTFSREDKWIFKCRRIRR